MLIKYLIRKYVYLGFLATFGFVQQSIKIIAEIVVNMSIVARIKFNYNLKNSSSAIGYYSYTNRCGALKTTTFRYITDNIWIFEETGLLSYSDNI
ncbi:MAG: hypothetical protein U9R54_07830 [Bacteroidota bacterium]|nr:hypothetical protein [Bacteroidota bacterium]